VKLLHALLFLSLPLLAAVSSGEGAGDAESEDLLGRASDAFAREDFAAAAELYEQAEARTTDPGQVAFDLATARYQLAASGGGGPGVLREAELGFRCCLESDPDLRGRALLGLANCLLLRSGGEGGLDPVLLREAVESYDLCLREAGADSLREAARHNRERARLLLAQVLSSGPAEADQPPGGEEKSEKKDPPSEKGAEGSPGEGSKPDPDSKATPAEKGAEAKKTDSKPLPGGGALPLVPDSAESGNLSQGEAAMQLEQAAGRVLRERQSYRLGKGRLVGGGARNW
jgi:hypothetical protein